MQTLTDSQNKTAWFREAEYRGRTLWIESEEDCPHPQDALDIVCGHPVFGDDRVMCHGCYGVESDGCAARTAEQ